MPLLSFPRLACGTETLELWAFIVYSVPGTVLNRLLPSSANEVLAAASLVPGRNPAPTGSISESDFKVAISHSTDEGSKRRIEEGLPASSQGNTLDLVPVMSFQRCLKSQDSRVVSSSRKLRTRN